MRSAIIALCVLGLAACSSKPKESEMTEPTVTEAQATTTTATEPTTSTTTEPMAANATPATTAMDPVPDGDFPAIEGTEKMTANCTRSSDGRMVSVLDRTGGGCGVVYTKYGNKRTVAMANYDMAYCDKVFDNIKGNLTTAGYDCGGGAPAAAAPAPKAEPAKAEETKPAGN